MLRESQNPFGLHKAPRRWSNDQLRTVSKHFSGDVINVSAWKDSDKEGGWYHDYFPHARTYSRSNYLPDRRGLQNDGDLFLDLEDPGSVGDSLQQKFDVVLNHTTLEHVYDVHTALDNICALSSDIVILVVPTLQLVHAVPDPNVETDINAQYSDYWRFTPHLLIRLLQDRGFEPLIVNSSNARRSSVYTINIGSRRPESWSHIAQPIRFYDDAAPRWVKQPFPGWNSTRASAPFEISRLVLQAMRSSLVRALRGASGPVLRRSGRKNSS